jgi:dTDP-D-glucose 4,6-dehydratase
MKILITGGASFIGSKFIKHVLTVRKNYAVVNYDNSTCAGNLKNLDWVSQYPN